MPFLSLNGVTVRVAADSFVDNTERIGGAATISASGRRLNTRNVELRQWTGRTTILARSEFEALRRLIDGHGHVWHFDSASTVLSTTGISAAGGSPDAAGGKFGGHVTVSSTANIRFSLGTRMFRRGTWQGTDGFTIICWKKLIVGDGGDGTSFYHHIITGSINHARAASANPVGVTQYRNGVAGSYGVGNWFAVESDGDVLLYGYSDGNVGTAYDYDDVVILPFAIPSTWASGIYTFHNARAWSDLPKLTASGDAFAESVVTVDGVSGRALQHNAMIAGAHANNARALEFDLHEG
jgi:hypothetical protein